MQDSLPVKAAAWLRRPSRPKQLITSRYNGEAFLLLKFLISKKFIT